MSFPGCLVIYLLFIVLLEKVRWGGGGAGPGGWGGGVGGGRDGSIQPNVHQRRNMSAGGSSLLAGLLRMLKDSFTILLARLRIP